MLQQASATSFGSKPKAVFLSYCHSDESLKKLLMMALRPLEFDGLIATWHDRMILAGQHLNEEIEQKLHSADLFLFLVSDDFLKSNYCREIEARIAMDREIKNEAFVIPIILSKCDWHRESFARLMALPKDGNPLSNNAGLVNVNLLEEVVEGLRLALLGLWNHSNKADTTGATVGTYSLASTVEGDLSSTPSIQFQRTQNTYVPLLLSGMKITDTPPFEISFMVSTGNSGLSGERLKLESEKVRTFFSEMVTLDEHNCWVNLSPYESNRMLPKVLAGTQLGRALLASDYQLKVISSSLLHPDCETGRAYWREIYARARSEFGTSKLPFRSFQKVTVMPVMAKIFERRSDDDFWKELSDEVGAKEFAMKGPRSTVVMVVKSLLSAVCESDYTALEHNSESGVSSFLNSAVSVGAFNEFAAGVFRELVVPAIEHELNNGVAFAEMRQHYNSQILAVWFQEKVRNDEALAAGYGSFVGSNSPKDFHFTSIGEPELLGRGQARPRKGGQVEKIFDHVNPADAAFEIPENAEFYQKYIELFRRGLYRVARSEEGDAEGETIMRVYFSGAMEFGTLTQRLERLDFPVWDSRD